MPIPNPNKSINYQRRQRSTADKDTPFPLVPSKRVIPASGGIVVKPFTGSKLKNINMMNTK